MPTKLLPGQWEHTTFSRFGLLQFADRFLQETQTFTLHMGGSVAGPQRERQRYVGSC